MYNTTKVHHRLTFSTIISRLGEYPPPRIGLLYILFWRSIEIISGQSGTQLYKAYSPNIYLYVCIQKSIAILRTYEKMKFDWPRNPYITLLCVDSSNIVRMYIYLLLWLSIKITITKTYVHDGERQCVVLTQYHLPFDKNNNGNQQAYSCTHNRPGASQCHKCFGTREEGCIGYKIQNKFNNVTIKNKSYRSLFEFNRSSVQRGVCR
jgi:hypothetical protein